MNSHRLLGLVLLCSAAILSACHSGNVIRPGAGAEVAWYTNPAAAADAPDGVFDRTEVLIAYHKWEVREAALRELVRERDAALAAGDKARAHELERRGEAMQDHSHHQLAGRENLDDIAQALHDQLPAIAGETGVARIIERGGEAPGRPTVDVTAAIIARMPPRQN